MPLATALLACAAAAVAHAQQPSAPPARTAPKAAPPAAAPKTEAPAAQAPSETTALRQRVEQLEEQLVDMQVMVGTLESLARGGGGQARAAASGPGSAADQNRIDSLEAQVRILSAQVEQLQQGRAGSTSRVAASAQPPAALPPPAAVPPAAPPSGGGFTTQVTPERDPIGQIIGGNPPAGTPAAASAPSLPPSVASDASSKQLYETAYGLLLQQDYASAEAAFEEFLKRFPNDQLAGNAQYWLGETFYVRGQYRQSAAAFLKGYQTYARSAKAPDSLLKLAMSLDRLGQRDAACSSYSELTVRFPTAPGAIRSRAETERRRLGCA